MSIYAFDVVCRVMYVAKAKNRLGDTDGMAIKSGDLVVVGLVSGHRHYKALVPKDVLDSFAVNNPTYGFKYRFQSRHKPLADDNIVWLDNIIPSRSFITWFF